MHFIRLHHLDKDLQTELGRTIFMRQFDYVGQVARMWGGGREGSKKIAVEQPFETKE